MQGVLEKLNGLISEDEMQQLNYEVEVNGKEDKEVATERQAIRIGKAVKAGPGQPQRIILFLQLRIEFLVVLLPII